MNYQPGIWKRSFEIVVLFEDENEETERNRLIHSENMRTDGVKLHDDMLFELNHTRPAAT